VLASPTGAEPQLLACRRSLMRKKTGEASSAGGQTLVCGSGRSSPLPKTTGAFRLVGETIRSRRPCTLITCERFVVLELERLENEGVH